MAALVSGRVAMQQQSTDIGEEWMSKATHCDGPGCDTWARTLLSGWVSVKDGLDFCSWDCAIKYGATREPVTGVKP